MDLNSEAVVCQWILDTIKDAIFQIDPEGRILRCNRAFSDLVKKEKDEIIGANCHTLVHDRASFIEECPFLAAKKSLKQETLEYMIRDKWFYCTAAPIIDAQGKTVSCILIMQDITESRQTDVLMERYAEELLSLVEASGRISRFFLDGDIYKLTHLPQLEN